MEKKQADIFEGTSRKNYDGNFFLVGDESTSIKPSKNSISEPARRLNDYDFNLLREDAYKDVSDDVFKLEYKIARTEEEISTFNAQIESAKDIGDYELAGELSGRKRILEEDYEALLAIYNDKSLSAKITDKFFNLFGNDFKENLKKIKVQSNIFSDVLISKMPKQFANIFELKKSLTKLENLNKSVDELISMNIPYGENINKYEQLSKYIIKANSIQAEISRYIKK